MKFDFQKILQNQLFWIILSIAIVLVIIYYSGKKAGERNVDSPYEPAIIPTPEGPYDASILSNKLKEILQGAQIGNFERQVSVLSELALLPIDGMFVAVVNHYNKHHHETGKFFKTSETLRQQLEDEWYIPTGSPSKLRDNIISRMNRLQLN